MKGHVRTGNSIVFSETLTLQARAVYAAVRHYAWEAGRREETDAVRLPTVKQIARDVRCSETALKGYLRDLAAVGAVVRVRVRNQSYLYLVYDAEAESESDLASRKAEAESASERSRNTTPYARAGSSSRFKTTTEDTPPTPPRGEVVATDPVSELEAQGPPPVAKIDGRNLPLDAILDACHIDPASNRVPAAAVALNSRGNRRGIRDLFWIECCRRARTLPDGATALAAFHDSGEQFERTLATRIGQKAAAIRRRDPWRSTLSPSLICEFWLDVGTETGPTVEEIAREYLAELEAAKGGAAAPRVQGRPFCEGGAETCEDCVGSCGIEDWLEGLEVTARDLLDTGERL